MVCTLEYRVSANDKMNQTRWSQKRLPAHVPVIGGKKLSMHGKAVLNLPVTVSTD